MEITIFQANGRINAPELPGIYSWYYRPSVFNEKQIEILEKIITHPTNIKTEVGMRYGLSWETDSEVELLYSSDYKPINEFLTATIDIGDDLIIDFLQNMMVPYFAKPLYIGIHRKNLRERIEQHRDLLNRLWNSNSPVSRYLEENPRASVEKVLDEINSDLQEYKKHSFALNARVKGLTLRDLAVCVFPIDEIQKLRRLEQILQVLVDPICGRR